MRQTPFLLLIAAFLTLFLCSGCARSGDAAHPDMDKVRRLIARGDYATAFIRLNEALAQTPKDPNVHLNLGWLYLYTDDFQRAEKEWEKARSLAPNQPELYHLRGALFSDQAHKLESVDEAKSRQNYEEAVRNFQEALRRDKKNDQTYFDLATALLALNRNQEALETLDQGFEHIPKQDLDTQVDFQIASCSAHARLRMYEEAIADCHQAKEFTNNPAQRQRIDDMIENMKLMNPPSSPRPPASRVAPGEEGAVIDESASD